MVKLTTFLISGFALLALALPTYGAVSHTCNDGIQAPGSNEKCEDYNANDNDDCLSDCKVAECGDGALHTSHSSDLQLWNDNVPGALEECDDGNNHDGDGCSSDCLNEEGIEPACGDDILQVGEACDDGNTEDGDGCSSSCEYEGCGNGVVDPGEECDDGNVTNNGDICRNNCTFNAGASCGDGVIQVPESCDDGSQCADGTDCTEDAGLCAEIGDGSCAPRDGDGCSNSCSNEADGGTTGGTTGGDTGTSGGDNGSGGDSSTGGDTGTTNTPLGDADSGGGCSLLAGAGGGSYAIISFLLAGLSALVVTRRRIR